MPTAATPLSPQPMLTAQAGGRGRRKGGGAPEARALLTSLLPTPFLSQQSLAGLAQSRGPGAIKRWTGTEHHGEGALGPRGRGAEPDPPPTAPH